MSTFSESEHPRGLAGQFAAKPAASESGVELAVAEPSGQAEPARGSAQSMNYFRFVLSRVEAEQAHAEWAMKNGRLEVAKAVADEVALRYPDARFLVAGSHPEAHSEPRRLFAVRDRDGADLWTHDPTRGKDPMREVSDAVSNHDALSPVVSRTSRNWTSGLNEKVVAIAAVHDAHAEHKSQEPRR